MNVDLQEYAITIPQQVDAGPQIWKMSNIGQQPHVMYMSKTPSLLTMDEIMALLQLPDDAPRPQAYQIPPNFRTWAG